MPPADADALTDYIRAIENPFTVQLADLEESKAMNLIGYQKMSTFEYLKASERQTSTKT